jgi:amidase
VKASIVAALAAGLVLVAAAPSVAADPALDLERLTVADMQGKMAAGQLTSVQLTRAYINRKTLTFTLSTADP